MPWKRCDSGCSPTIMNSALDRGWRLHSRTALVPGKHTDTHLTGGRREILSYRKAKPGRRACIPLLHRLIYPGSSVSTSKNNNYYISGLKYRECGRRDLLCWPRNTLYPQKLALTSPTRGGRLVGTVRHGPRQRTLFLYLYYYYYYYYYYYHHHYHYYISEFLTYHTF
jgi:hypothetical protein